MVIISNKYIIFFLSIMYAKLIIFIDKSNNKKDKKFEFVNSKTNCKIFRFILTPVNQTLKKPAGLPSGWGRAAPKERKM